MALDKISSARTLSFPEWVQQMDDHEEMLPSLSPPYERVSSSKRDARAVALVSPSMRPQFDETAAMLAQSLAQMEIILQQLDHGSWTLDQTKERKKQLSEESVKRIQECIEKSKEAHDWNTWGKIVGWIGAIGSILAGIGCVLTGAGAVAGALLITSGSALLASELTAEFGGWQRLAERIAPNDRKKQREIVAQIEIWLQVMAALAALASAWGASRIAHQALVIANSSVRSVTGVSQGIVGSGAAVKKSEHSEAEAHAAAVRARLEQAKERLRLTQATQEEQMRSHMQAVRYQQKVFEDEVKRNQMIWRK